MKRKTTITITLTLAAIILGFAWMTTVKQAQAQKSDEAVEITQTDEPFALELIRTHGVAAIPLSPFMNGATVGGVLRFCFAKRDDTLQQAAERLAGV